MSDDDNISRPFDKDEDFLIGAPGDFTFSHSQLYQSIVQVTEGLNNDQIPDTYVQMLREALPETEQDETVYDENFNIRDELTMQIQYVRTLRNEIFDKGGKLRKGYTLDDAKHILNASRDLVKILQSSHDQLLTQDRMQAIELAFIDTVAKMAPDSRERYAELLKNNLEIHDPG